MRVIKRSGEAEDVSFDKVVRRIRNFCDDLSAIDPDTIAQSVCSRIYDGVSTATLDDLAAQLCASLCTKHPHYATLAARIVVSNHHKKTSPSFSETMSTLYHQPTPLISEDVWMVVQAHRDKLNAVVVDARDYFFDYFGFKTLERSYLMRVGDKIVERPQHMWLRVALGVHGWDIKDVIEAYELMSQRYFTHATPTLFNAGTPRAQMSSCYLMGMEDSISGIYKNLGDCAQISKYAGGIGQHIHNIRSRNAYIRGTNGKSSGIVPMCRVFNETARYVNQSGRRLGSIAMYMEPWHADIFDFVVLRRNTGAEEERCRDLFLALWTPDLFMRRVEANAEWSLFDPDECPGLSDVFGPAFDALYERYEREGRARKTVKAHDLWLEIVKSQLETGTPYMLYKDACQKVNQSNLGVIKSSNLCSEILLYSDPTEYAVCNLASIVLPTFVEAVPSGNKSFNFAKLHEVVKKVTRGMDKVITRNFYPVPETRRSNLRHRPIGIGMQGLHDTFLMLRMPFESDEAAILNRDISETMYHAAVEASTEMARERAQWLSDLRAAEATGDATAAAMLRARLCVNEYDEEAFRTDHPGAYSTFEGSPASKGQLQFDLWGVVPSDHYDWASLKAKVVRDGMRNSMLIALMPTASTSQIMGYTESFEAMTANIYQRRTLAGEFIVINKYLIQDLIDLGIWNEAMKNRILAGNGSIQSIEEIPAATRALYKTVWEIKQRAVLDQSAARGPFVCHTQSLNVYVDADADIQKITNIHFYGWKKGLKTGQYYLRKRPKAKTMAFALDPAMVSGGAKALAEATSAPRAVAAEKDDGAAVCRRDNPECTACSS